MHLEYVCIYCIRIIFISHYHIIISIIISYKSTIKNACIAYKPSQAIKLQRKGLGAQVVESWPSPSLSGGWFFRVGQTFP